MKDLGQLFITGIEGISLTEEEKEFIQTENIGGVILFKENFYDSAQLAELINDIQKLRDEYPLFICTDHEGGRVIRFKKNFTQFPSAQTISKTGSPKIVYESYQIMANELTACGINLNLTPCCDILTNSKNTVIGDRSFGNDVKVVEAAVSAAIRGLQTNGILACAKHFPGHGGTTKDSHLDLPLVKTSLEDLEALEIKPFIKASKSRVEFMMMAHLVVEAIDKDLPTTLSPKAYKYLREKLKFNKIIISDDMEMKAISDRYTYGEAAVLTLKAGCDVLEYRSMKTAKEAFYATKDAINSGKLDRNNLEKKIKRVMACKKEHLAEYKPIYIPSLEKKLNDQNARQLINKIESLTSSK